MESVPPVGNPEEDARHWSLLIEQLEREVADLPESNRVALLDLLGRMEQLQIEMHQFFLHADGEKKCCSCKGACCDSARNYLTLANILHYLLRGELFPEPNFKQGCPYLTGTNCSMPPGLRPYTCISFLCSPIDEALNDAERKEFYHLEKELRQLYRCIEKHFAGGSMRGIFNVMDRLQGGALLAPATASSGGFMELQFSRKNGKIDDLIDELMDMTGVYHPRMIREMIISALKAGHETDYLADLKQMRTTMKEMRYTSKVFGPYRDKKKVTIFGSARTEPIEPIYQKCVEFSKLLAERNYMVITGGGGGIMQAGNEGAGANNSFAVNIQLPFEQDTNPVMAESDKVITYKYFFNRKVAFLKEADAVALFPGGFGTLDEAMEILTLVQTGKNPPIPLVLIDDDEGNYWENWFRFVKETLLPKGLISGEDFSLFTVTRSAEEAAQLIDDFYTVYHSSRYVGETLVIRLTKEITQDQVESLADEFSEIMLPGTILRQVEAFSQESDQPDIAHLPRLALNFNQRSFGLLKAFIRRLNTF